MKLSSAFAGAALALVGALLAACGGAPPRPLNLARDDYASVQRYAAQLIRHEMDKNAITGLSIALVDDQRIVWAEGFGYADKERNLAASGQTIYRVGSISKLFTAAAAMQLAERGQLDIDRPLRDYLPEFAVSARFPGTAPITPRKLMTHHSGLPRDFAKGMFTPRPAPFTDLVTAISGDDADYPPDRVFAYSNVGVTLLGHAIQNVGGQPYAAYMQEALLAPLGMDSATFATGPAASELMSKAYRRGERVEEVPLRDVPAGGLNASVVDLSRFLAMVFADGRAGERQVLRAESVAAMLRPQNTDVALDLNFHNGLGWMLATLGGSSLDNAGPVAHHGGAMLYFRAQMYALPAHKLGVVVLANSNTAGQTVDRVARETLALALEAKTRIRQPARVPAPAADAPWPRSALDAYVGDYTTAFGHLRIGRDGQRLRADALGRRFALVPRSDGLLGVEYAVLGLFRIDLEALGEIGFSRRRVAGRDVLVASRGGQEMLLGERIEPAKAARWRQRLGRYEIVDAGADHTSVDSIALVEDDGILLAELTMTDQIGPPAHIPVQPLADDEALLLGTLADGGARLRCIVRDDAEQCRISGYTLQKAGP